VPFVVEVNPKNDYNTTLNDPEMSAGLTYYGVEVGEPIECMVNYEWQTQAWDVLFFVPEGEELDLACQR